MPRDLTAVFHRGVFDAGSTIGYPPPWPLVLGILCAAGFGVGRDLLFYNLVLKLPVIAANVALAYLTGSLLQTLGSPVGAARRAWTFLLLNPMLLYFTAAWGQIDGIVAVVSLGALVLLLARRWDSSALVLALAVCVKPIALPVALGALLYLTARSGRAALRYGAVLAGAALAICLLPFLLAGWSLDTVVRGADAVWRMSGTLSYMTVLRLLHDPFPLPGAWWLLGLAWIPALAVTVLLLRRGLGHVDGLLAGAVALVLVFYLTRTWLSANNVILVLPLLLVLTTRGALDRRILHAVWAIPLAFSVAAWTPLRLLWVTFPETMLRALDAVEPLLPAVLAVLAALVVTWQVTGWWTVVTCLRRARGPARTAKTPPARDLAP